MTVTREPIHLALESAPTDRFDDDSPRVFRVVAFVGMGATRRHKVALTRDHDTEQAAMAVFADKVLHATTSSEVVIVARREAMHATTLAWENIYDRLAALEAKRGKR